MDEKQESFDKAVRDAKDAKRESKRSKKILNSIRESGRRSAQEISVIGRYFKDEMRADVDALLKATGQDLFGCPVSRLKSDSASKSNYGPMGGTARLILEKISEAKGNIDGLQANYKKVDIYSVWSLPILELWVSTYLHIFFVLL